MVAPVPVDRVGRHRDCRDGGVMPGFRFRPLPVPAGIPAIVRDLFEIMAKQRIGVREAAKRSGVDGNTILTWRLTRSPSINNYEAVANALGYGLRLVRHKRKL